MATEIKLAQPRGFCAGVDRAIEIVNRALEKFGAPIYVRHEVVHNRTVVEELRHKGAIFVDEIAEVPEGATVIFSAHGVSQLVRREADLRKVRVFDATCPLVTKVHNEISVYSKKKQEAILIGHAGHPEVEGTMGQYDDPSLIYLVEDESDVETLELKDPGNVAYVTQTTLSVDDTAKVIDKLRDKFPKIKGPKKDDICYATQNRQDAVKQLALESDLILVVGSANSSNSNRLKELAERLGVAAYLIDTAGDIEHRWISGVARIGVTSGASAPEHLVQEVVRFIQNFADAEVEELIIREELIEFSLPKELR
ncbi:MAG: 4-hydroxy-3-methylbut-2-enyl diphosphate reductase [Candidatus Azotimanducaceae bacterium]|jgi:4-hydroxy-3-methylbut-2-enyl diphosphate reductase